MAVAIITTVLSPAVAGDDDAGPYDLTDLATAKDELSIPDSDSTNDLWLERAISQASIAIKNFCKRVFQVEGVQDLFYIEQDPYPYQLPGGVFPLQLSRWPLLPSETVFEFLGDVSSGSAVVLNVTEIDTLLKGTPVSGTGIPAGAKIDSIDKTAGSITLDQAATGTHVQETLSTGFVVVQNRQPGETCVLVEDQDYRIDADKGWLICLNRFSGQAQKWAALPVTVQYSAGYATIPDDLVDACLRQITGRFKAKGRDPMLKSQDQPGLGNQQYWIGSPPGAYGALAPEVVQMVEHYRVPSTA